MLNLLYRHRNKILIFLFILYTTHFFNYSGWNPTLAGWCSYFIYSYILIMILKHRSRIKKINSPFKYWPVYYMVMIAISVISGFVLHGTSVFSERGTLTVSFVFLIYYYLYIKKISEKDIITLFTLAGLCIFVIQIFQLAFPNNALFGIFDPDESRSDVASMRNGIYRFMIGGVFFTLFCLYYYWSKLCEDFKMIRLLMCAVFLISMYLFLTRQIMFATIITLVLSSFFVKNKKIRQYVMLSSILLCIILVIYSETLFGNLLRQTSEEASEDNIRLLSFSFYWNKIISNPVSFLFGNGHPSALMHWQYDLKLFLSDIGLIGEMYYYGIFWIMMYFLTIYMIMVKYRKSIPLYLKLFIFGTFINSILVFPYRSAYEYFIWISIIYICSLHISFKYKISRTIGTTDRNAK